MTATTAGDDGDLRRAILAIDDLVVYVALHGRVRLWNAEKRGINKMRRIVDEMFGFMKLAICAQLLRE